MKDIAKMKKGELKDLFIKKLIEVEKMLDWCKEHTLHNLVGSLVIESNYLEHRSYKDPTDIGHKWMDKQSYTSHIKGLQKLITKLEEVKNEFEKGNLNQVKETIYIEVDKSNPIQTDKKDIEEGNLNQSKRGGKRVGAGRKGFGETRKVSLTLPSETWAMIEELCEKGNLKQSKVLRDIIERGIKHP